MRSLSRFAGLSVARIFHTPALAALLISIFTTAIFIPASASANETVRFYPATRHSVGGAFLKFYDRYGGINLFGYPVTDEVKENGRTVQYFERQRMEYHSEYAGTANEVQLSLLGTLQAQGRPSTARVASFTSSANRLYVSQTGHSLSYSFLSYWKAYGGLRVFGYPLTEPANENGYLVQYFERARMEYHPEKRGLSYGIELGHLGKEYLQGGVRLPNSAPSAPAAAPPPSAPNPAHAMGQELITLLNGARQQGGLAPAALNSQLSGVAQSRSNDMAARNYFSHVTPEGTDFMNALKSASIPFTFTGEIIAKNNYPSNETVSVAFNTFMNSPGHKAIIMDGRYNTAGVGVATDGKEYYYFTVIFTQR